MEINKKDILDLMDDDKKEDFTQGDLVLIICCRKCDAQFELNPDAIAVALMTNATVWDYIKSVQLGKCRECNKEMIDEK